MLNGQVVVKLRHNFHVYFPWVNTHVAWCLKSVSNVKVLLTKRRPYKSMGLLHDCENFAELHPARIITRDNGPALHRGNIWVEQLFYLFAPAPPQISAARNSFKHDKDYYEGLLEYYQHSSFLFPAVCLVPTLQNLHTISTRYTRLAGRWAGRGSQLLGTLKMYVVGAAARRVWTLKLELET